MFANTLRKCTKRRKIAGASLEFSVKQIVVKYWSFPSVSWIIYIPFFLFGIIFPLSSSFHSNFFLCVLYAINRFRTVHFISQYASVRRLSHYTCLNKENGLLKLNLKILKFSVRVICIHFHQLATKNRNTIF